MRPRSMTTKRKRNEEKVSRWESNDRRMKSERGTKTSSEATKEVTERSLGKGKIWMRKIRSNRKRKSLIRANDENLRTWFTKSLWIS